MSEKNTGQEEINDPRAAADCAPSGTSMEFEDLTLPRDRFSSFRHFFIIRPFLSYYLVFVLVGVFLYTQDVDKNFSTFISVILPLSAVVATFSNPGIAGIDEELVRGNVRISFRFLGEVVRFRPGINVNKWDVIAARLNRVFHQDDSNMTPYFFYDGSDCLRHFIKWYVDPRTDAKRSQSLNAAIQPIINEVVKVYNESAEECWREYTSVEGCYRQYTAKTSDISEHSEQQNVSNDSDKGQKML